MSQSTEAGDTPSTEDIKAYIDREVISFCRTTGWKHQVRRAWTTREKQGATVNIDDIEWKLIPDPKDGSFHNTLKLSGAPREDRPTTIWDEVGSYFILRFDSLRGVFILIHDTTRTGNVGHLPTWVTTTSTEIGRYWDDQVGAGFRFQPHKRPRPVELPLSGVLASCLKSLTSQFQPNYFTLT